MLHADGINPDTEMSHMRTYPEVQELQSAQAQGSHLTMSDSQSREEMIPKLLQTSSSRCVSSAVLSLLSTSMGFCFVRERPVQLLDFSFICFLKKERNIAEDPPQWRT